MKSESLIKATEIHNQIKELDQFIFIASMVPEAKVTLKTKQFGVFVSQEYNLDQETRNEVLEVLRKKLIKLHEELERYYCPTSEKECEQL